MSDKSHMVTSLTPQSPLNLLIGSVWYASIAFISIPNKYCNQHKLDRPMPLLTSSILNYLWHVFALNWISSVECSTFFTVFITSLVRVVFLWEIHHQMRWLVVLLWLQRAGVNFAFFSSELQYLWLNFNLCYRVKTERRGGIKNYNETVLPV